ncbi:MAG: hypothetical protein EOM63_01775, partial [Clostridia bacterium]|nr:hypothetical protein [Clostridia bacterium]
MKFSCEKSTLLDAINISSRAVSGKSAMALLEGVLGVMGFVAGGLLLHGDAHVADLLGHELEDGRDPRFPVGQPLGQFGHLG